MKIKKQLILLSAFIVFIPIACALYMKIQSYINSRHTYMIRGTQDLEQYTSKKLSQDDINKLLQTLKILPPDIQCLFLSENNNEVLFSTIPEFPVGVTVFSPILLDYMNKNSDKYFYQFTNPLLGENRGILITGISRIKHMPKKRMNIFRAVIILLIILISICFVMIILISRTIFTSIITIENKTEQLVNGSLSEKIISENDNTKKNEITSIMESLEKMRLSLIEVMNRKNKFIMGISHDLRTPVAIIKGYSEAITDGVITNKEDVLKSIELIQGRTSQLSEMIDSLINYMKLNDNEIREKLTPGSICTIIKDFAKSSILTGNVFKRNIISNINLPNEYYVPLNEQLVVRSFENIFSNALRYTNDNDTIEINAFESDNKVILEIKDTGIGIDEKDLKNIFDMFYRGTNSRREEGMGIGLSVVKNIMDTHGWEISVTSEKDKGSCFTISIPVK